MDKKELNKAMAAWLKLQKDGKKYPVLLAKYNALKRALKAK